MSNTLTVMINNEIFVKYDKRSRLPAQQRRFLDQMDADMDRGIQLGENHIDSPDRAQRSYYVAMMLIRAILNHNENLKTAACAYLSQRDSALQNIRAEEKGEQITMQLEYMPAD